MFWEKNFKNIFLLPHIYLPMNFSFMWGLSEVLISYELIEYNEESSDDIEDSDKNDDTIEEDTLMHIYFNQ